MHLFVVDFPDLNNCWLRKRILLTILEWNTRAFVSRETLLTSKIYALGHSLQLSVKEIIQGRLGALSFE